MLDAFAGDVASDTDVVCLAADLIDFVDINNAHLAALDVMVGILKEAEDNILHVFADIARFGDGGGVSNGEGDIQYLCEGAGEEGFSRAGGAEEKDVALLDLDIGQGVEINRAWGWLGESLVVVMDGHGQHLLGGILTNDVLVEEFLDLARLEDLEDWFGFMGIVF